MRQRYNKTESLNRILRLFQNNPVATDVPETPQGEILSESEALSDLAELLAGSLPSQTAVLPPALSPPYGHIYFDNNDVTVDILVSGSYTRIPTGSVAGLLNGMTFANSRELVVGAAGNYFVGWNISFHTASIGTQVEGTVMVNNTGSSKATAHGSSITSAIPVTISGNGIFALAVGDKISVGVRNHVSTEDVAIQHHNLTAFMLHV